MLLRTGAVAALAVVTMQPAPARAQAAEPDRGWVLSPVATIGREAGPAEYSFARIVDVGVGADGAIYVLDGGEQRVKVYDPAGRYRAGFGGMGSGPGEFRNAVGLRLDSLVHVFDGPQQRYSVFSTAGVHRRTERVPAPPEAAVTHMVPLRHGYWAGSRAARLSLGQPGHDPNLAVLVWRTGGAMQTLATFHSGAALWHRRGETLPWGVADSDFGTAGAWAVMGDSILAVADGYAGVVKWYRATPSGLALLRTRPVPGQSRAVASADVRAVERRLRTRPENPPSGRVTILPPPRWSIASEALFADDGSLWIRNAGAADGQVWTVFDREGAVRVRLRLPAAFELQAVRGSTLYGTSRTGNDVPVVRVLRLSRRGG